MSRSSERLNEARLTEELAARLLGWRAAPGRFLTTGRAWVARRRFAPFERIEDAVRLLDLATDHYRLDGGKDSPDFAIEIRIGSRTITASGKLKARTITTALACALGLLEYPHEVVPSPATTDTRPKDESRSR
jgi:hypothetical protein